MRPTALANLLPNNRDFRLALSYVEAAKQANLQPSEVWENAVEDKYQRCPVLNNHVHYGGVVWQTPKTEKFRPSSGRGRRWRVAMFYAARYFAPTKPNAIGRLGKLGKQNLERSAALKKPDVIGPLKTLYQETKQTPAWLCQLRAKLAEMRGLI